MHGYDIAAQMPDEQFIQYVVMVRVAGSNDVKMGTIVAALDQPEAYEQQLKDSLLKLLQQGIARIYMQQETPGTAH